MTFVNYKILDRSIDFYEGRGYKRVESPWLISEGISDMTRPSFAAQYVVHKEGGNVLGDGKRKALVASGEQSFLYMIAKGYLPPGTYQTITPCFRNEPFDETHVKYFMKNELINYGNSKMDYEMILSDAHDFFKSILEWNFIDPKYLRIVKTDIGHDIELNGVEIGSYGLRENTMARWCYGTGVAEPRFSMLMRSFSKLEK